jgi:hypothetical protein
MRVIGRRRGVLKMRANLKAPFNSGSELITSAWTRFFGIDAMLIAGVLQFPKQGTDAVRAVLEALSEEDQDRLLVAALGDFIRANPECGWTAPESIESESLIALKLSARAHFAVLIDRRDDEGARPAKSA